MYIVHADENWESSQARSKSNSALYIFGGGGENQFLLIIPRRADQTGGVKIQWACVPSSDKHDKYKPNLTSLSHGLSCRERKKDIYVDTDR